MGKLIIYLEDDANMRRHTTELLRKNGFCIEDFKRIDQVKEFFIKHMDEVECIITDLNMDDEWLEEYIIESDGGMLSGWVWLQRFVFPIKPLIPTIIYSGYIPYLKDHLNTANQLDLLNKNKIECVEKGSNENEGFEGLLKKIRLLL